MSAQMKAVRVHRYSGVDDKGKPVATPGPLSEAISMDTIDEPTCKEGHVLISTNYVGIQYPDMLQAQGLYQQRPPLPYVPGADVTGIVKDVGAGVDHVGVGDRVIAQLDKDALAETLCAPAKSVWKAPDNIHLSKCANIGRNYFAAYHSLKTIGELKPGGLVLINGASGGVGMAGIDLAKAMGAKVIAGVSTPEKEPYPTAARADKVLCYGRNKESYKAFKVAAKAAAAELGHPQGADVILDMVQGDLFEALVSNVRPLGRICLIGFTAGQKPIRPGLLLIKQAAVVGSLWVPWAADHPEGHRQNVAEIHAFMQAGAFEPRADRLIPFENFLDAFQLYENNEGRGNTVICVKEE